MDILSELNVYVSKISFVVCLI